MATIAKRNVEIIEGMYDAFNQGDIDAVLEAMASDVIWTEPETEPLSPGTHTGRDVVMKEVFEPLAERFEEFLVDVDRYIDGGDCVIVEGRFDVTPIDGERVDIPFAHICDLTDGKLQGFTNYTDTALLREAVGT